MYFKLSVFFGYPCSLGSTLTRIIGSLLNIIIILCFYLRNNKLLHYKHAKSVPTNIHGDRLMHAKKLRVNSWHKNKRKVSLKKFQNISSFDVTGAQRYGGIVTNDVSGFGLANHNRYIHASNVYYWGNTA